MRTYSYLFFFGGRLDHQESYANADDDGALALADLLSCEADIEVWDGDRLVARLHRREEPPRAA